MDELEQMMSLDSKNENPPAVEQEAPAEAVPETEPAQVEAEAAPEVAPEAETPANPNIIELDKTAIVPVSEILLANIDKCVDTSIINSTLTLPDIDLTNYIVYTDNKKKIPCVYDSTNLYFDKNDVFDASGNSIIQSIDGRRSGFVIRCTGHDLVMTKNFIYKCELDANGNITSVYEYGRIKKDKVSKEKLYTDITPTNEYDAAIIFTAEFLKKVPKKLEDKTIEGLRTEVRKQYNEVNDINAVINIIKLRVEIGC